MYVYSQVKNGRGPLPKGAVVEMQRVKLLRDQEPDERHRSLRRAGQTGPSMDSDFRIGGRKRWAGRQP